MMRNINKRASIVFILIIGLCLVYSQTAMAEPAWLEIPGLDETVSQSSDQLTSTIDLFIALTLLTLLPTIIIATSGFTRIIIVLSLLKNALGVQQSIPKNVLIILALFMTFFIMTPTLNTIATEAINPYFNNEITTREALDSGSEPLKEFMLRQTSTKDLQMFLDISGQEVAMVGDEIDYGDISMGALVPAFLLSELRVAFQMGFLLFIPFLIVDIVTGSILMSMGMFMLPPVMIALPFKLLLFVMVDGWKLLVETLILSFR